jgi:hypothetical protein
MLDKVNYFNWMTRKTCLTPIHSLSLKGDSQKIQRRKAKERLAFTFPTLALRLRDSV